MLVIISVSKSQPLFEMNLNTKSMLESIYSSIFNNTHDHNKSWDLFLEILASNYSAKLFVQFSSNIDLLISDKQLASDLSRLFNPELLKDDFYDYLGDLFYEIILSKENTNSKPFLSVDNAQDLARHQIFNTKLPETILDPSAGTGRLLLAAHKAAPNAILFGVEKDIRKLRIAIINLAIHGIPGYLLHANPNRHDIDISTEKGRYNWNYANSWNDVQNKLFPNHNLSQEVIGSNVQ